METPETKRSLAILCALALVLPLFSCGDDKSNCTETITAIDSAIDPNNCPTLCTRGRFAGPPGLLERGTSRFVVETMTQTMPISMYTGTFELTTEDGTLELYSTGQIDTSTTPNAYSETEEIRGGTGLFAKATGTSESAGIFDGMNFLGTISGRVCLP